MVVLTAVPGSRSAKLVVSLRSRVAELTALGLALRVRRRLSLVSLPKMFVTTQRSTLPTPSVSVMVSVSQSEYMIVKSGRDT